MKNQLFFPAIFTPSRRQNLGLATSASALLFLSFPAAHAETYVPAGGTSSWAIPGNWNPASVPNAVGAVAQFNGNNTGNRTIHTDSGIAGFTVGAILFDLEGTGTSTNSLQTGTVAGSKLILDNGGAGAILFTHGSATGNNTISVPLVLNDLVIAQVDQTTSTSQAGSLNLTAAISGPGSILKQGEGLMTFGTGAKTYTGETVLNGGRTRMSSTAQPSATSSFTINAGAQLTLINGAGGGSYTFGTGPLNLNGTGATSGPYSAFPGAIRNDTNLAVTINNPTVLQSDTLLHVQGAVTGSLTFTNTISGVGSLTLMARNSNADLGQLFLNGNNSYEGGTIVNGGILNVNSDAALGAEGGSVVLDGLFFNGFLDATLRATGNVTTTARTLVVGSLGNNVGGTINTNGFEVTFGVGSTITGTTLKKIGANKLTIAGTQTYSTLTTSEGRTDLASALGTGDSTINANAETNISVDQNLATLNIGEGAVVTVGAPLPAVPPTAGTVAASDDSGSQPLVPEAGGAPSVTFSQVVPEPGSITLLLAGLALLAGARRREGH